MYILLSPYLCFFSFVSRFVFTRRWYINQFGIFHAKQTSICLDPHQKQWLGRYHGTSLSPPVTILTVPRRCFFCGPVLLFMFRVCPAVLFVHCSLMVTCWERANLLALLYVLSSCVLSLPNVMSWVRCGTWLFRLLIFAFFLTFIIVSFVQSVILIHDYNNDTKR